jgi:hypothetical protein
VYPADILVACIGNPDISPHLKFLEENKKLKKARKYAEY